MAPPTWAVGQVLTASDVNTWFVPLAAYKTSTQSVTSSTTLVNDTALVVAVAANAVYYVRLGLVYDGAVSTGTAAGIKYAFTVPAGATFAGAHAGMVTTSGLFTDDLMSGFTSLPTSTSGTLGAGNNCGVQDSGILTTAGTAGNFQLQWAQNVSNGTATRVFAGSHLILTRVG